MSKISQDAQCDGSTLHQSVAELGESFLCISGSGKGYPCVTRRLAPVVETAHDVLFGQFVALEEVYDVLDAGAVRYVGGRDHAARLAERVRPLRFFVARRAQQGPTAAPSLIRKGPRRTSARPAVREQGRPRGALEQRPLGRPVARWVVAAFGPHGRPASLGTTAIMGAAAAIKAALEAIVKAIFRAPVRTTVGPAVGPRVASQSLRYFAVGNRLERYQVRPKIGPVLQEGPLTVGMSRELGKRVARGHAIGAEHDVNGTRYDPLRAEKVCNVPVRHRVWQPQHGDARVAWRHE